MNQGTYTPQVSDRLRGGTELSTLKGVLKRVLAYFSVYRGEVCYEVSVSAIK